MAIFRCNTCNGEYDTDQEGGYYHACSPIRQADGSFKERDDKRDENVVYDEAIKKGKAKREGKGRTEIV